MKEGEIVIVGEGPIARLAVLQALAAQRHVLWVGGAERSHGRDDPRVYALAPDTIGYLERLGVWGQMARNDIVPYDTMHVCWEEGGSLTFSPLPGRGLILGAMVPAVTLHEGLDRALTRLGGHLEILPRDEVSGLRPDDGGVLLEMPGGGIRARVVLACDGRDGRLGDLAGIPRLDLDVGAWAVVGVVRPSRAHDGIARQVFTRVGPLGLLPRADGRLGYVWSLPTLRARDFLAQGSEEVVRRIEKVAGEFIGSLRGDGMIRGFRLAVYCRTRLVGPRLVLLGDAAHGVHPYAGLGLNLGVRDLVTLASLWPGRGDPGARPLLRRYERRRRPEILAAWALLESLRRGLEHPDRLGVRARLVSILDRSEVAKAPFVGYAIGLWA